MAISFTKYVDITSAVGGTSQVPTRELIGRMFTNNVLLPTGSFIDVTSAQQAGDYFGKLSVEYSRAVFYFSFISKTIVTPNTLSYARWVDVDTPPMIFGKKLTALLSAFQAISDGSFQLTLGNVSNAISGLDFTTVLSFADVALAIQAGINSQIGIQWTGATVVYNAQSGGFNFVGGDPVNAAVAVSISGVGTDIVNLIGWGLGAIFSDGSLAQSITDTLQTSSDASDNFGSFLFIPDLTINEIQEAATWNSLQNIKYMYCVPVSQANSVSYQSVLSGYSGTGLTNAEISGQYPEQAPMMLMAATDYDAANGTISYMYQQFSLLTPTVTTTAESDALDALRINYYGRTQTAGKLIDFYQRGVLFGGVNDPLDMNTYANEIWFKDAAGAQIMNLFLALQKISANTQGRAILLNGLLTVVQQALFNGTISVGKTLNNVQILFITQVSNDPNAWYQVQNSGYWLDVVIEQVLLEFQATYTLIYSKDDSVRKVNGTQILI